MFDAQNALRTNPKSFISKVTAVLNRFKAGTNMLKPKTKGGPMMMTREGPKVYKECIAFLKKAKPVKALAKNEFLTKAAQFHTNDTGPQGIVGHVGS